MSDVLINGVGIEEYGAKLLDYKVGPVELSDSHLTPKNSMVPIKLMEILGSRKMMLTLEFTGVSVNAILRNMSDLTALLISKNEITLPDGFIYCSILDTLGTPESHGELYYSVEYTFVCYRHGPEVSFNLSSSASTPVTILGNREAPARIRISGGNGGDVTVMGIVLHNCGYLTEIDGYAKKVTAISAQGSRANKYADCEMDKFPVLAPGAQSIPKFTGYGTVTVYYTPMYL